MPLDARRLLLLLLVCAFCAMPGPIGAQGRTPPPPPPKPVTLADGWQVKFDRGNRGVRDGWQDGDSADRGWRDVSVPHVFNAKPIDDQFLGTVGWYRIRFKTPAAPDGFGWQLRFEGARRDAIAWLNGKRIGRNRNQFQPFTLQAEGMRAPGQVNELVVRVANRRSDDEREGWWNWGGLTRAVHLEPVGAVDWRNLGLLSDARCDAEGQDCRAIARTDGTLVNRTERTVQPLLQATLRAPDGVVSTRVRRVTLAPGERRRVGFPVDVEGQAALWSPGHPNLYDATVSVTLDGAPTQVERHRVGLRFVRVRDGQLSLNGRRLQLRGASIQEDLPGRGPALRPRDMDTIVSDLKRLGANVARAQYPVSEGILDRLDEAGILFWNQAAVYHEDEALKTEEGRELALDKVRTSVRLGRNHPSVLTHSVANELSPYADSMPGTRAFLVDAARVARRLDDTVPAALDLLCYPNIPRQEVYSAFGLLGINHYYGWYDGKEGAQSTERFSGLKPFLRDMRSMYPRQAQMITEYGAESTFSGPRSVKETYEFQSDYVERTLEVVSDLPWMAGAIYWTAREFYVKPNWDGGARRTEVNRDALHNKGLLHYDGRPKPAFWEAQRIFERTPIYKPR